MAFYKTVVEIEILSDRKVTFTDLDEIHYEITEGEWSGRVEILRSVEISAQQMAKLAEAQYTDPEFFGIDAKGNPVDELT